MLGGESRQEQPSGYEEFAALRIKPWYALIAIILLTLVAGWTDLPRHTLDPQDWKGTRFDIHKGLDLQGGLQVVLQAAPPKGEKVSSGALAGTKDVINRRISGLGVSDPLVQTRGSNQIVVELPGVKDPERAVNILQQTALLEIIDPQGQNLPVGTLVNTSLGKATSLEANQNPNPAATPSASATANSSSSSSTASSSTSSADSLPTFTTIVTGKDLSDAYVSTDQVGQLVVAFTLKSDAAKKFYNFTSANIGKPMSIVVDKKVIETATIQSAISNNGEINGLPASEVQSLALQLKSGALAVPMKVVASQTVGPTLGQDSINKSIIAGCVGLAIVALFMILFYRFPGILSVFALGIYTLITFALFKAIPVTLTLEGIAGFILSIGMAVDANVLIFSRLKEELRLGHTIARSVEAGFDHAWPSIRDSNISTMITCVILYWFGRYTGTSVIEGFALTLFIGVAVSMFTAITVTRTFLRVFLTSHVFHNEWWFGVESATIPTTARRAIGD